MLAAFEKRYGEVSFGGAKSPERLAALATVDLDLDAVLADALEEANYTRHAKLLRLMLRDERGGTKTMREEWAWRTRSDLPCHAFLVAHGSHLHVAVCIADDAEERAVRDVISQVYSRLRVVPFAKRGPIFARLRHDRGLRVEDKESSPSTYRTDVLPYTNVPRTTNPRPVQHVHRARALPARAARTRRNPSEKEHAAFARYVETHWGEKGEFSTSKASAVTIPPLHGSLVLLGHLVELTYATVKGGDGGDLTFYEHEMGEGGAKDWEPPMLVEHHCNVPRCPERGKLALVGGTYKLTDRGIVG